ncbi:12635_t:CDS:10, partial [Dentiscutata heterogama]
NQHKYPNNLLLSNNHRHKYLRPKRSIFVCEDLSLLTLIPENQFLNNSLEKSLELYLLLKVTNIEPDKNDRVYVPLIPGYGIYTHLGEHYFYICLEWSSLQKYIKDDKMINYRELQNELKNNVTNETIIKNELSVKTEGWQNVAPEIVQAMAIKLVDTEAQCQALTKKLRLSQENIKNLQNQLENRFDSSSNTDELNLSASKIINTLTTEGKLDSSLFVMTCCIYQLTTIHQNELQNMGFSQAVAGARLAAGVNREELRTILAYCGITRQSGYKQYFNYQNKMHHSIIEIEGSFDCAWSHVREALQASGKLIFNEYLEAIARCQNPSIDNDLFVMQTEGVIVHLSDNHSDCWPEVCWVSTNSNIELETPNLKLYNKNQKEQLLKFLHKIMELKEKQKAANLPEFSKNDHTNILKIWKERETKHQCNLAAIEERNQQPFNFNQDLVPYSRCIQDSIQNHTYIPSFANIIKNFGSAFLCDGCHCFECRFATGLCLLCDTLVILRTGGEKSLIYSVASILSARLTVVFTSMKSLMDDQMHDLVKQGIPATILFGASDQPPAIVEKIFAEIASNIICVLFVTAEKYVKNFLFRKILKKIEIEVQSKPGRNELFKEKIFEILNIFNQSEIGKYHRKMITTQKSQSILFWKEKKLKYMVATNAFGMGININDVRLVLHITFSISLDNFVQEIRRAGRDRMPAKQVILYTCLDIQTLLIILHNEIESMDNVPHSINDETDPEERTRILTRHLYLDEEIKNIFEMILFCENQYECRQQLT